MNLSFTWAMVVLALLLLQATPAMGQDVDLAEHVRLTEEMRRLARRNAWNGVEAAYRGLLELAARNGDAPTFEEHYLGAQAARALGDVNATYSRLNAAVKCGSPSEVRSAIDWLANIDANYGTVSLLSQLDSAPQIIPRKMPFAPDQRAAIQKASQLVAATGRYDGLLPAGVYEFGSESLLVEPGAASAPLALREAGQVRKRGLSLAYSGIRMSGGMAYTGAGPGSTMDAEPGSFSGLGPRIAVGLEVGLSPGLGLLAQVGYQGVFGQRPSNDPAVVEAYELQGWSLDLQQDGTVLPFDDSATQMHSGYLWSGLALRAGALGLAAGPLYVATFSGSVSTLRDGCGQDGAAGQQCVVYYTGGPRAGGVAFEATYDLVDLAGLRAGLSFQAGVQTDTSRWYNWGQVGFAMLPATSRRD